jgi:hypothetical protein
MSKNEDFRRRRVLSTRRFGVIDRPIESNQHTLNPVVGRRAQVLFHRMRLTRGWLDRYRPKEGELRLQLSSASKKVIGINTCLPQDRAQSAFRHVTGMIRNRREFACRRIEPNFVTTGCLPFEFEAESAQPADDVAMAKARQPPHAERLGRNNQWVIE